MAEVNNVNGAFSEANDVSSQVVDAIALVSQILGDSASTKDLSDIFKRIDDLGPVLKKLATEISNNMNNMRSSEISEFLAGDFSHVYSEQQTKLNAILSEALTIDDVRKYLEETSNVDGFKKNALLAILDNDTKKYYTSLLGYAYQQYASSKTPEEMIECMRTLSDLMNLCKENGVSEDLIMKISRDPNEALNVLNNNEYQKVNTSSPHPEQPVQPVQSNPVSQPVPSPDDFLAQFAVPVPDPLLAPFERLTDTVLNEDEKELRTVALSFLGYDSISDINVYSEVKGIIATIDVQIEDIIENEIYKELVSKNSNYYNIKSYYIDALKKEMRKQGLQKINSDDFGKFAYSVKTDILSRMQELIKKDSKVGFSQKDFYLLSPDEIVLGKKLNPSEKDLREAVLGILGYKSIPDMNVFAEVSKVIRIIDSNLKVIKDHPKCVEFISENTNYSSLQDYYIHMIKFEMAKNVLIKISADDFRKLAYDVTPQILEKMDKLLKDDLKGEKDVVIDSDTIQSAADDVMNYLNNSSLTPDVIRTESDISSVSADDIAAANDEVSSYFEKFMRKADSESDNSEKEDQDSFDTIDDYDEKYREDAIRDGICYDDEPDDKYIRYRRQAMEDLGYDVISRKNIAYVLERELGLYCDEKNLDPNQFEEEDDNYYDIIEFYKKNVKSQGVFSHIITGFKKRKKSVPKEEHDELADKIDDKAKKSGIDTNANSHPAPQEVDDDLAEFFRNLTLDDSNTKDGRGK